MNGRADFDKSLVVFLTVYVPTYVYRILYRGEWWTSLQPSCPAPFHTIWYSHAGDSGYITSLSLRRPRSIRFDRSVCNKWMDVSWLPPFLFFLLLSFVFPHAAVSDGHCLFSTRVWGDCRLQLKRDKEHSRRHLSTFGNKWRCFE
jgi:hypothetical protein